jgi:hypothetical protein
MKSASILLGLATLLCTSALSLAGAGPGPWSSGTYYAGYLDGKYFGVVSGNNISGVLGFALSQGAPPFRTDTVERAVPAGGGAFVIERNTDIIPDITQNYFVIFVEGRTYRGVTTAGFDISDKKVAGTLQGTDPIGTPAFAGALPTAGTAPISALPIVNRGLSGGFEGKIKSDKDPLTFKANGQLSTPANRQTVVLEGVPIESPGIVPPMPPGTITNVTYSGTVSTETTPFKVRGVRTSYAVRNPQADADAAAASSGTGGGAATP